MGRLPLAFGYAAPVHSLPAPKQLTSNAPAAQTLQLYLTLCCCFGQTWVTRLSQLGAWVLAWRSVAWWVLRCHRLQLPAVHATVQQQLPGLGKAPPTC